jgi:hypothetical protein
MEAVALLMMSLLFEVSGTSRAGVARPDIN